MSSKIDLLNAAGIYLENLKLIFQNCIKTSENKIRKFFWRIFRRKRFKQNASLQKNRRGIICEKKELMKDTKQFEEATENDISSQKSTSQFNLEDHNEMKDKNDNCGDNITKHQHEDLFMDHFKTNQSTEYLKMILNKGSVNDTDVNQKIISEIKSYVSPPVAVHDVIVCVYLLLGKDNNCLKTWNSVKLLLNDTGKNSLKEMMKKKNFHEIPQKTANLVKTKLIDYDFSHIIHNSQIIVFFYIWILQALIKIEK